MLATQALFTPSIKARSAALASIDPTLTEESRMPTLLPKGFVRVLVCYASLAALPPATAQEPIYQWTNDKGQTIFSDQPPAPGQSAVQLQMPAAPSAAEVNAARQRSQAIKQQADELAEARRQREELATTKAQQPATPAEPEEPETSTYDNSPYPYYQTPPGSSGRLPLERPVRPTQPIARPGLRR